MNAPFNQWPSITPSDTVDLPKVTHAIWVGGTGDVAAVNQSGIVQVITAVPAGSWLPLAVKRINATGTTATAILALYEV
jgi:hypothetical protein